MLINQILAFTIHGKHEKHDLSDISYSVSDIQDYFKYIIKKNEILTNIPPIRTYVNKIKDDRITFKTKKGRLFRKDEITWKH